MEFLTTSYCYVTIAGIKMANDVIIRGKDRLQEISVKLEQSHLVYLQTDDSPLKLQQRHKLEGNLHHLAQLSTSIYVYFVC